MNLRPAWDWPQCLKQNRRGAGQARGIRERKRQAHQPVPLISYEKNKIWKHLPASAITCLSLACSLEGPLHSVCWGSGNQPSYSLKMGWLNGEQQRDF